MKHKCEIITVGLCPCWDTNIYVDSIAWGEHKQVAGVESYPAGKALNVSRALAWMGQKNTAAGLWGADDYAGMREAMKGRGISIVMTAVPGRTRRNITLIEKKRGREMHLRMPCTLADRKSLRQLRRDISSTTENTEGTEKDELKKHGQDAHATTVVFAGSMPGGELIGDVLGIIKDCRRAGARVVVDTSGEALRRIVGAGGLMLIKPNVLELRELAGAGARDTSKDIIAASRKLLDRTQMVLVSRGAKGAILVSRGLVIAARCVSSGKVINTVAAGDFLVAGFLNGLAKTGNISDALADGVRAATARVFGMERKYSWREIKKRIVVKIATEI